MTLPPSLPPSSHASNSSRSLHRGLCTSVPCPRGELLAPFQGGQGSIRTVALLERIMYKRCTESSKRKCAATYSSGWLQLPEIGTKSMERMIMCMLSLPRLASRQKSQQ